MADEEFDWGVYNFNWLLFPEAEEFLTGLVEDFIVANNRAGEMASTIKWSTSSRFLDWVDHMVVPQDSVDEDHLAYLGFEEDPSAETMYGARCLRHKGSRLFPILLRSGNLTELAIRLLGIDTFLHKYVRTGEILGQPLSPYQWLDLAREHDNLLTVVERRGYDGFELKDAYDLDDYLAVLEAFRARPRELPTDVEGLEHTSDLVEEQLDRLSVDRTADAWFHAEWEYWQSHNRAAQVQKARQDHLGLGWANHDHQAYRCSRECYTRVVSILELLGMRRRESFFAGHQAGWGAQVLEQPVGRFVVFCDVDMAPEEADIDFATEGFPPRDQLGTIGLWVGLHGESMLQAGIHHLAIDVSFDRAVLDLAGQDVTSMVPFSSLDYLKQTFTHAERWKVLEERTRDLLDRGLIDEESFDGFEEEGAIGSHLELIQRGGGFKGFNQDSVSQVIAETDPRKER